MQPWPSGCDTGLQRRRSRVRIPLIFFFFFFFFLTRNQFFETHICFLFFYSIILYGIVLLLHYYFFVIFYSFCNILFSSFRQTQILETKSLFAVSESLDSASESVFPWQILGTTGSCTSSTTMSICQYCRSIPRTLRTQFSLSASRLLL